MGAELKLTAAEVEAYLAEVFPQTAGRFTVLELEPMRAKLRMRITEDELRPGGTVSGPAQFTAADCAFYVATLAMIGKRALAVTTHCGIDFMRRPEPVDLIVEARILKLGRALVVGDALVFSDGKDAPVARASLTYSIPPAR